MRVALEKGILSLKMTVTEALKEGNRKNDHGCSTKEKDHLIRSTKKIKGNTDPDDAIMGEDVSMGNPLGEMLPNPNPSIEATNQVISPLHKR